MIKKLLFYLFAFSVLSITIYTWIIANVTTMTMLNVLPSKDVILVYTDNDVCDKWMNSFPGHAVILFGNLSATESYRDERCYYVTLQNGSLEPYVLAVKFRAHHLYKVKESPDALRLIETAQARKISAKQWNILYESDEAIFNCIRQWGCGGANQVTSHSNYSQHQNLGLSSVAFSTLTPFVCSEAHPPMTLAQDVYFLTSSSSVLLQKRSFWLMPFLENVWESSITGRKALSMVGQKLLWVSGNFAEVSSVRTNNSITPNEVPYHVLTNISAQLDTVRCNQTNFVECTSRLLHRICDRGFISKEAVHLINNWFTILQMIGYELPEMNMVQMDQPTVDTLRSYISQADEGQQSMLANNTSPRSIYQNANTITRIQDNTCKHLWTRRKAPKPRMIIKGKRVPVPAYQSKRPVFKDIWLEWKNTLLIVVFNRDSYTSIPYYESLYRRFFPNILYCGPNYSLMPYPAFLGLTFSFISYGDTPRWLNSGSLNYECLTRAFQLGYDVTGYLQVADDAVLMPHLMKNHNTSKVWTSRLDNMVRMNYENLTACDDTGCHTETDKYWHKFKNSALSALRDVRKLANYSENFETCSKNIAELFGGPDWTLRVLSDVFYVPTRFMPQVTELFEVFRKNEVYLEITIPTVLHCIIPQEEINPIYTHFHNVNRTLKTPTKSLGYSPDVLEPYAPDTVVMTHRFYPRGRMQPLFHITPDLMRGATFYHPNKMGRLSSRHKTVRNLGALFCSLVHFYNDPSANLARAFSENETRVQ